MPIFFKVNSHKHPIRQRQLFNLIFVTKTKIKDKAVKRKDLILVAFTNKERDGTGRLCWNEGQDLEYDQNKARKRRKTK